MGMQFKVSWADHHKEWFVVISHLIGRVFILHYQIWFKAIKQTKRQTHITTFGESYVHGEL